jgi:F-type H+-transporting ATPase subunit b
MSAAQLNAQHLRESDLAATRVELDRMREKALADIEAEKERALADLRSQVADLALAAAGRLVGETMTDARQRRLVEDFLANDRSTDPGRTN